MKRLPWILFFIISDAIGKLTGVAQRGHVNAVRASAANIEQDQLQGASQSAVGLGHVAENILPRPEAKLLTHRAVDHDQRRGKMRGRLHAMNIEALITD